MTEYLHARLVMIAPNFAEGLAYNVHMQWKKFMREFYQTWMQFLGKVLKQIQRQEFNWHVGSMERAPNFTSSQFRTWSNHTQCKDMLLFLAGFKIIATRNIHCMYVIMFCMRWIFLVKLSPEKPKNDPLCRCPTWHGRDQMSPSCF